MSVPRSGVLMGASAYLIWGFFPLYFPLLEPASALEILAHRIVWSLALMAILVAVLGRWAAVRRVFTDRRRASILTAASTAIAVNWGTYIWAVNNAQVVEAALGYFINPLVTVLFGVILLGERLRAVQWAALGLALVAVIELTVDYGHPPYVSLVLAFSFGTYGLMKKKVNMRAVEGLAIETFLLAPVAAAYLGYLQARGSLSFAHSGPLNTALLVSTGVMTAFPLLLFAGAAGRIPLTMMGLLQYLTPTTQFLLGVVVLHEDMTTARWVGFVLIWTALAILTTEALRHRRQEARRAAADAGP